LAASEQRFGHFEMILVAPLAPQEAAHATAQAAAKISGLLRLHYM
jgi:hypothetical protein